MEKTKRDFFNFKPFNRDNMLKLICYVSAACLFIFTLVSIIVGVTTNFNGTMVGKNVFSDFAETISYCIVGNPYEGYGIHSIYPPFAYLPFYLFALICKKPLQSYLAGEMTLDALSNNPLFIFSFVLFFAINMALILLVVAKMSKLKGKPLAYLLISVACFGPMLYCFGRGNVIITAVLFALLFFWLYNSEKRWARELANVCLACSIAVKIYPAFLLIFFLKDRRWLDLLKTLAYSLFLLFIPFLFVKGGFGNIKHIWNNFTHFNSGEGRDLDYSNIGLDATCSKFAYLLSVIFGGANMDGLYGILSKITRFGLVIAAIVILCCSKKSKKNMQAMLVAICTYELFQGVSYGYTMMFLIAPIVVYVMNFEELDKKDKWFYGICFALIACPLFYIAKNFIVQSLTLIVLVVKALVDLAKDDLRIHKETKAAKLEKKEQEPQQETKAA